MVKIVPSLACSALLCSALLQHASVEFIIHFTIQFKQRPPDQRRDKMRRVNPRRLSEISSLPCLRLGSLHDMIFLGQSLSHFPPFHPPVL